MIKVTVYLEGDAGSHTEIIEISKDEILQLACNKVAGMFTEGSYNNIQANEEIKIETKL